MIDVWQRMDCVRLEDEYILTVYECIDGEWYASIEFPNGYIDWDIHPTKTYFSSIEEAKEACIARYKEINHKS